MRISDWSSDVCSSDLTVDPATAAHRRHYPSVSLLVPIDGPTPWPARLRRLHRDAYLRLLAEFDRSEERRVGKECVVRVDLGGRRIIKKQSNLKMTSSNTMQIKQHYTSHY